MRASNSQFIIDLNLIGLAYYYYSIIRSDYYIVLFNYAEKLWYSAFNLLNL